MRNNTELFSPDYVKMVLDRNHLNVSAYRIVVTSIKTGRTFDACFYYAPEKKATIVFDFASGLTVGTLTSLPWIFTPIKKFYSGDGDMRDFVKMMIWLLRTFGTNTKYRDRNVIITCDQQL